MNKIPRFPVELRKVWTGHEVQQWIDENIKTNEHQDGGMYKFHLPEGYKVVPVEPTPRMLARMVDGGMSVDEWSTNTWAEFYGTAEHMAQNYKAMLEVAPTIEAGFYYYDEGVNSENQ